METDTVLGGRMKKIVYPILFITAFLAVFTVVKAYNNVGTHPTINGAVADAFVPKFITSANPLNQFKNYTFVLDGSAKFTGPAVTKPGNWSIEQQDKTQTPKEWIKHGGYSADEPEVFAALRHFYDPKGIKNGKHYLTNRGTYWEGLEPNPGIDARSWAISDPDNHWCWYYGLDYVVAALEESDKSLRDEYMARAYRCLGETMHLLADMGCPVHVRNDSHAPAMGFGLMGDPDPYESAIIASVVSANQGNKTESALKDSFRAATVADQLFLTLATFTNENFFTNQTISGVGVRKIDPIITDQPAYPKPKLEDMTYVPEEFAFYKTFSSGAKVKMCKDRSYFNFRGYPYIDKECAESQATVLIPNIIEAGANLMRLFVPKLQVEIKEIDADGYVRGEVRHTVDDEYIHSIDYNGPVRIYTEKKELGTLDASLGKFSGQLTIPEDTEEVYAEFIFGGIHVRSDPYTDFERNSGLAIIEDNTKVIKYGSGYGSYDCFENITGKVKNYGPGPSKSYPRPSVRIDFYAGGDFLTWKGQAIPALEPGEVFTFDMVDYCDTRSGSFTWKIYITED